ncbi:atp synthase alpha subunit, partial [Nannochloropsis gaditana CCMP526]|uniref:atp synthase alpha subunit n=1 Tax=Nannochloropsis gaditana (strain CCMP526) TaxID=1093141 RepID=UPI00029F7134
QDSSPLVPPILSLRTAREGGQKPKPGGHVLCGGDYCNVLKAGTAGEFAHGLLDCPGLLANGDIDAVQWGGRGRDRRRRVLVGDDLQ